MIVRATLFPQTERLQTQALEAESAFTSRPRSLAGHRTEDERNGLPVGRPKHVAHMGFYVRTEKPSLTFSAFRSRLPCLFRPKAGTIIQQARTIAVAPTVLCCGWRSTQPRTERGNSRPSSSSSSKQAHLATGWLLRFSSASHTHQQTYCPHGATAEPHTRPRCAGAPPPLSSPSRSRRRHPQSMPPTLSRRRIRVTASSMGGTSGEIGTI